MEKILDESDIILDNYIFKLAYKIYFKVKVSSKLFKIAL